MGLSGYWCRRADVGAVEQRAGAPSLEKRKLHRRSPSVVATVIWTGCSTPCRRPVASTRPTARSTALGGSSSSPKVRPVEQQLGVGRPFDPRAGAGRPRRRGRAGSAPKSRSSLPGHPQPAAVAERVAVGLLTAEPLEARMWARTSGEVTCSASSRRLRSFQAGSVLRKTPPAWPGRRTSRRRSRHRWWSRPPSVEWRLWTISECLGL